MYRGKLIAGNNYRINDLVYDTNRIPIIPDSAPIATFYYQDSTVIFSRSMSKLYNIKQIGLFEISMWFDASAIAPAIWNLGYYIMSVEWTFGGTFNGRNLYTFELVAGGNSNGEVCSLHWYEPPQAKYIVNKTTSGLLQKGKNPR